MSSTRTFSFQQIVFAGFGLASATVLVLAGITWNSARQSRQAAEFVNHTQQVLRLVTATEASFHRAESGQRAYINIRRQIFLDDRDAAISELAENVEKLAFETRDNGGQQKRVRELRTALDDRIRSYREVQQAYETGTPFSLENRLESSLKLLARIRPQLAEMTAEEQRLLGEREAVEARRTQLTQTLSGVFLAALVLLLWLMFSRVRADLAARTRAEAEAAAEREHDAAHAQALTLYNAESDRKRLLDGTLALLAQNPRYPVSVFYALEEWGTLRMAAARGAPDDIAPLVRFDDGCIGTVARTGDAIYLTGLQAAGGLRIETGLATLSPAALLMQPVTHQGKLLGVLALGTSVELVERDRRFVERLCAQFGVALHNVDQLEGLNLLATELRERGEDIQRKNLELERASRMKSEFVANMSHELRTPLNAVIGFSEVLRDGLAGPLNAEQAEYTDDIYNSGKHLLSLINDILDLSKVEAGQMVLELGAANPAELVDSGLAIVRERAAERRIRLTHAVPRELAPIRIDLRRAKQIVFNLLGNAVKFTPEGGSVALELERVPRQRLQALALAPGDGTRMLLPAELAHAHYLEIRVADNGIGIDAAGLAELFQPFKQIDSSLSKRYEGTGLGLTLTQRLADLHGGGLMVHSAAGRGSTFTVWLPWRDVEAHGTHADAPAEPADTPADAAAGRVAATVGAADDAAPQPLILVIDDDTNASSLLRVQLQAQGYRVEMADSAERGLELAAALRPDAIVLDVILPGMHGWDMLARLKEHPATEHVPVVICSITDEPRRGFALGAAQVLVKPVSKSDLLSALGVMGIEPQGPRGRVLVVDDDPKAVTLVCKHLEAAGFEPLHAYGGEEALSVARHHRPDAIVLDLMMPHVSGFDVVAALARRPETAGIAILVLTAKLIGPEDRDLLRGRVERIMEKADFQPSRLVAEVRRSLHKKHSGRPAAGEDRTE